MGKLIANRLGNRINNQVEQAQGMVGEGRKLQLAKRQAAEKSL